MKLYGARWEMSLSGYRARRPRVRQSFCNWFPSRVCSSTRFIPLKRSSMDSAACAAEMECRWRLGRRVMRAVPLVQRRLGTCRAHVGGMERDMVIKRN